MEKYKDSDVELMSILLKLQEQTSPIRMSIGYTVGGTVRQGIILYEAAPKVIETLIEKGYTCDLNGCGMRVFKIGGQWKSVASVKVSIPPRPFLGISEEDEQDIKDTLEEIFEE